MSITDDKDKTADPAAEAPDTASETTDAITGDQAQQPEAGPDAAQTADPAASAPSDQDTADNAAAGDDSGTAEGDEPKTFDAEYVGKLRAEAAGSRVRVKELEAKLHRLLVEQDGQLADPADLEFDPAHLDDPEALASAIAALLEAKPHLKARRFEPGAAAQGAKSGTSGSVDLAGLMRQATM
ncbi:hypothetical protein [Gordonia aichiensis]|uniref:Scaffolding protein n=1 Tax=Gordonia aichiensis NBRC 108223 TaxID=1220583 RepID=L7KMW2_9ACTN|nr:hypothetical protein [Gordonia aichiensis]GAC50210.1 hypothetical protein GOACH_22_00070 [Gordonia aichiensis NBRC 108223]